MGLPVYAASKKTMSELPELLASYGITVKMKDYMDSNMSNKDLLPFTYECSANLGSSVQVSFNDPTNRVPLPEDSVIVVLTELSPSWLRKNKLLEQIKSVLVESGATQLPHHRKRKY